MLVWCTKVWFQSFLRKQSQYIICPPIFWKKQYKTAVSELSQEGCLYSSRGLNVQKITSLNPIVILVIFHEKKLLANTYCVVKKIYQSKTHLHVTDAFSDIIGHHNISETFYTFFAERCSKAVLGSLGFGRHFGKVPFQTAKCDGETYGKIKYSIILFLKTFLLY